MAITLDTIALPDLIIEDEFASPPVAAVVEQSIINTPVVFEAERASGRPLTLVGGDDWGWIGRSTLAAVYALASVPGATYPLIFEGTAYTVRFRNEEPPAISAAPVAPRPNAASTDYYRNVIIKLMEV